MLNGSFPGEVLITYNSCMSCDVTLNSQESKNSYHVLYEITHPTLLLIRIQLAHFYHSEVPMIWT